MSRWPLAVGVMAALTAGRAPGQAVPVAQDPYLAPVTVAAPAADPATVLPIPRPIWRDAIELGVNGASGNSEVVNLRAAWNGQWRTDGNLLLADLMYFYAWQDGGQTVQQALFNTRDDVQFPDTAWSLFGATQLEYDELRGYQFRVASYAGFGYAVADDDAVMFRLRGGVGRVREYGSQGLPDRWVTEAVFGCDFQYRLDERSSYMSVLDYFPRADDFGLFRVRFRAGYEYVLDPETGAVLRLGVVNRYDADPGLGSRNDLMYFTSLGLRY